MKRRKVEEVVNVSDLEFGDDFKDAEVNSLDHLLISSFEHSLPTLHAFTIHLFPPWLADNGARALRLSFFVAKAMLNAEVRVSSFFPFAGSREGLLRHCWACFVFQSSDWLERRRSLTGSMKPSN